MPLTPIDFGLESSIEKIRRQLTKQLTGNLEPEQGPKPESGGASPYNAYLLKPPLSTHRNDAPPFKPNDDDEVSLTMKRKHKSLHHRLSRAYASNGDLRDNNSDLSTSFQPESRCRSLPDLKITKMPKPRAAQATTIQGHIQKGRRCSADDSREGLPQRPRRWTMPSKALPAKVYTDKSLSRSFTTNFSEPQSTRTPAMISLRRATTLKQRPSSAPTDVYTSFPEPSFSRSKYSFLTKILGGDGDDGYEYSRAIGILPVPTLKASNVKNIDARPPPIDAAAPVFTEHLAVPFVREKPRRCSTRYISEGSVYEIIWDENIPISATHSTPSDQSRTTSMSVKGSTTADPRKHSVAMDKLETQLFKAILQSRKSSVESYSNDKTIEHQKSFQDLIDFKFSRFHTQAHLSNLPRSKASKNRASAEIDVARTGEVDPNPSVGYFPPLQREPQSQSQSLEHDLLPQYEMRRRVIIREGKRPATQHKGSVHHELVNPEHPSGYLIGQSTHKRRVSVDVWKPRSSISANISERLSTWERKVSLALGGKSVGGHGDEEEKRLLLRDM